MKYVFKVGDHGLASKRGHCTACSAVQAAITVEADDADQAVKAANAALAATLKQGWLKNGVQFEVTFRTKITKRQLVEG